MKKFFAVLLTVLLLAGIGVGAYFFLTQESSAHEHQLGEWVLTKEATCLEDGVRERKCACGYSVKETVKALGHTYGESQTIEQTCTQDGCVRQICVNCGDELKTNVVEATGHEYGDWVVAVEPTCTQGGMKKRTCNLCDDRDFRVLDMTPHVFSKVTSTVVDGRVMITEACSDCGYVSDERHEYEPVEEENYGDPYAFDCSTDFAFEIRCEKDEQYIYEHLRVLDFYYEGTEYENSDISLHPFVVRSTKEQHIWSIEPAEPYKENYTYIAKLSGEMSFLDYKQNYFQFFVQGPEISEVEYRDNILFLQALEEENPGYYPYDLSVDNENHVLILTLSQTGVFTDDMIGKTLCVGPCSSTEELSQSIQNCDIGVIDTIRWENDKTVVVLDAPDISDIYMYMNVSGNESAEFPENLFTEAQLQEMKYAYIESPAFVNAVTASYVAAKAYAIENDYSVPHYSDLKFDPKDIEVEIKVLEAENMGDYQDANLGFQIKIEYTIEHKLKKDGVLRSTIKIPIVLIGKVYVYTNSSTSFEGIVDAVKETISGDIRMHIDVTLVTEVNFSLGLGIELTKAKDIYYVVSKNTGKIHSKSCKALDGHPESSFEQKTIEELMRKDKNYKDKQCKVCKPFDKVSGFVVVNKKTLHTSNCSHLNQVKNPSSIEAFETYPLTEDFEPCGDCLPDSYKSFSSSLLQSFKDEDWEIHLEGIRQYTEGVLNQSKKEEDLIFDGNPIAPAVPIIPPTPIFNLYVYCNPEWDFKAEAMFNLNITLTAITQFGADLKREKGEALCFKPFIVTPGFDKTILVSDKVGSKNSLLFDVEATVQGKATAEIGIRGGIKLSLVGCEKLVYAGLDIVVGPYAEVSGVAGLEGSSANKKNIFFLAAHFEFGMFYKLRYEVYLKNVFTKNGSFFEDRLPAYSCGDNYAYFSFKDYEQTLNIGSDTDYELPEYLLGVKYYDLKKLTLKEGTLKFEGEPTDYSVVIVLRDKDGNPVNYCSYENGRLIVEDNAPKQFEIIMEITVVDEYAPQTFLEYLKSTAGRSNNGVYTVGTKEVIIQYESEKANMAITSLTPTTSPEIMEGEDVTFTITADEGVKYGVAFYYHNYQDELARFNTLEDSYTIKIPEAGTHMITVYPLDKNGEPIRGEGLGMSYRYVKAYSYDECASPKITTEDGKTVKQGVPYTITWKPSFYPTEKVVYSVYIQNDTTGTYSMVAQGLTETQITVPFSLMPDLGTYSFQVIASYTGTDREIHQSVSSWYPYGTVTLTLVQGDCAHTNTTVDEKKATCQENGYYHEICDDCGHRVTVIETFGNHEFKDGVCVVCGFGIENAKCPIPQFITKDQTIDLESDLLLEWVEQGSNIEYYLYVRHESVKDPADPGDAVKVYWFTGDHITVDGSFFSQTGDYMISLYARYKDVEGSQQDQGAYLTITVKELVCRHRNTNTVSGVEATCTEDGLTDGSVCADCGTVLMEQRKIPAMGHQWNDRTGQTLCQVCGVNLLCPAPVIFLDTTVIPYGSSLGISWTLDESAEYAVEYYLYVRCKDNPNPDYAGTPVFSSWIQASKCTISGDIFRKELNKLDESARAGSHEFEIFVYAHYTGYDGTQSGSARTVTVGEQQQLPSPEITSQNGQTVEQNSSFTLAWKSVDAEGAEVTYHVYLMKAGRSETNVSVGSTTGNMLTIPKAYFDQADTYVLYMVATDQNGYFTQSPSVGINVYVTAEEIKDKNDYDDPQNYANSFYYDYMGTLDNGEGYQNFYEALDVVMDEFHQNEDIDAELYEFDEITSEYIAGFVNYADFGLSEDEAFEVYWLYIMDHPLYYWISNMVAAYGPDIAILVNENYVKGSDRGYYNDLIYEGVEEVMQNVLGEESAYMISLSHYECVVKGVDYAYESDGITPQSADWAHSILGFFDHGKGVVCEGFAETYSLLLNFSEIPNTLVSGYSSNKKAHEWNLMQMDDGEWYWSDPTWDDNGDSLLGYDYRFFCVNDTQDVMYYALRDGDLYIVDQEESFMDDHFITWNNDSLDMNNALPARAKTPYAGVGDEMIMRDTFTMDDMTFAIAGYRKLQLTDVQKTSHVDIPEVVYYDGVTYTVISVGTIREDGTFGRDCVLNNKVTSIHIPKTIQCIWGAWMHTNKDHALYSQKLKKITVDDDNDYYYVKNGILNCK